MEFIPKKTSRRFCKYSRKVNQDKLARDKANEAVVRRAIRTTRKIKVFHTQPQTK